MTDPKRTIAEQRVPRAQGMLGSDPKPVRIWLLDDFRGSVGVRSIRAEEWHLRKARSLVKLPALPRGPRLHRERAMERLWPDLGPEAALNSLHYALHVARRTLEPSASAT